MQLHWSSTILKICVVAITKSLDPDLILPCNLTLLANVTHWQSKLLLLVLALYP